MSRAYSVQGGGRGRSVAALGLGWALLLGCGADPAAPMGGGTGQGDDGADEIPPELRPAPAALRRLLQRQYVNAVGDLLGPEAAQAAAPPHDVALNGFDAVGASQQALSDAQVDAYEDSARAVTAAAAAAGRLSSWLACDPATAGDRACLEQVVGSFGRLAWRRPLLDDEIDRYAALGTAAAADLGSFERGMAEAMAAMLQSPYFLYQVEIGQPDPADSTRRRLTPYELATRMSFFLLDTLPDAGLLADAEAGRLDDAEGIREVAWALLERPQATRSLGELLGEVWRLRDLSSLPKDLGAFPQWTPALAESMRLETMALIEDLVWEQDADFREVFTADYSFVNAQLAFHYGLPGAAELGEVPTRVTLAGHDGRGGLFGHASFQSLLAHVSSTSPTLRGKFVLENILCRTVPPPPPGVVTDLPDTGQAQTMRERLELHMSDPSCRGCHQMMDPIGFGLESYDGIGRFRTEDNGFSIDASGQLDGTPFVGAAGLGALVSESVGASHCLVRNLYRHATGHIETEGEQIAVDAIEASFVESGYRMQDLMVEIVASPAFRVVAQPE